MYYKDQYGRVFVQVPPQQNASAVPGVGQVAPQTWTPPQPQVWTPPQPAHVHQHHHSNGANGQNGVGKLPNLQASVPGLPPTGASPSAAIAVTTGGGTPAPFPPISPGPTHPQVPAQPQYVQQATCQVQTIAMAPDGVTQVQLCWNRDAATNRWVVSGS